MSSPEQPLVTVFVQAYNTQAFVGECLRSVLEQHGDTSFDVLVIDDASTDGTVEEIRRVADPRVRLVRHERNSGAIATANEGYLAARGEFIIRLDSDDRLRPGFLERAVRALTDHPDRGLVYADIAAIDSTGRVVSSGPMVKRNGRAPGADEWLPLLFDNFIPAPTTLVRRAALLPFLPIPTGFRFLDWYLTTNILESWHSFYLDDVLADYRIHATNMHRAMILDRQGEATSAEILDRIFAGPARRQEKRTWRRRVYAQHYLTYADKYFGVGMTSDARRCYWQALLRRPALAVTSGAGRRFMGSVVGRRLYDAAKSAASTWARRVV